MSQSVGWSYPQLQPQTVTVPPILPFMPAQSQGQTQPIYAFRHSSRTDHLTGLSNTLNTGPEGGGGGYTTSMA